MSLSVGTGLSNPEGLRLARELIRPQLPHDIHDYVLEGVCKAVDGIHVLAVAPTGGGKTGYFYGYILLLKALEKMQKPIIYYLIAALHGNRSEFEISQQFEAPY